MRSLKMLFNKKNVYIIIAILLIGSLYLIYNNITKNKEVVLDDIKLINSYKKDGIALMIGDLSGNYTESDSATFPGAGYKFNLEKSGCIDKKGNVVENALSYVNNNVKVKTKRNIMCYIYFDEVASFTVTLTVENGTTEQDSLTVYDGDNAVFNVARTGGATGTLSENTCGGTYSATDNTYTVANIKESKDCSIKFKKEGVSEHILNPENGILGTNGLSSTLTGDIVGNLYRYQGTQSSISSSTIYNYLCLGTEKCSVGDTNMYRIIGVSEDGSRIKVISQLASTTSQAWSNTILNTTYKNNMTAFDSMIPEVTWKYGNTSATYSASSALSAAQSYTLSTTQSYGMLYLYDYLLAYSDAGPGSASVAATAWISAQWNDSQSYTYEWLFDKNSTLNSLAVSKTAGTVSATRMTTKYAIRPVFYLDASAIYYGGTGSIDDPYIANVG